MVFLVGMRINRWWRPDLWLPVFLAMPGMIQELKARPESGFLAASSGGIGNPMLMVQYWRSAEALLAYARAKDATHFPAWAEFNRRLRHCDAVGLWHETYLVPAGQYESMRVNMTPFGIAQVGEQVPATGKLATWAGRYAAHEAGGAEAPRRALP